MKILSLAILIALLLFLSIFIDDKWLTHAPQRMSRTNAPKITTKVSSTDITANIEKKQTHKTKVSPTAPLTPRPTPPLSAKKTEASTLFTVSENDIPPGFENLAKRQTASIDVYFQGLFVGTYQADYTLTSIQFTHPKKLIANLTSVNDKPVILKRLNTELPVNENKICRGNQKYRKAACGLLTPEVAGVIFNRGELRADLFINVQYLEGQSLNQGLLPNSTAGFSFASRLYGAVQHNSTSQTFNSNLSSNNVAAYRQFNINANTSYAFNKAQQTENASFIINNLNANWRFAQYKASAGALTSDGNNFLPGQRILGASFSTSLDTVNVDIKNSGTPLEIYLPLPSTVSIFSDGRLLASQHYQAGRRFLETQNLPTGAYQVELKIQADNGSITTQTQFYSKTLSIPPLQFPQYSVQIGAVEASNNSTFSHYTNRWLYNVDMNKRLTDMLGVKSSLTGIDGNTFMTLGGFILQSAWQFEPSIFAGNKKQYGFGLQMNYQLSKFYANVFIRRIWAPTNDTNNSSTTSFNNNNSSILNVINGNSDQISVSGNYNFGKISLNLSGNYYQSSRSEFYSAGPSLRFPIYNKKGLNISGSGSITRTKDDLQYWLSLTFSLNTFSSNWQHYAHVGYTGIAKRYHTDNTTSGENLQWQSIWRDVDTSQNGQSASASLLSRNGLQTASVAGNYQSNRGMANIRVQQNHSANYNSTQYSSDFITHYIYTQNLSAVSGSGDNNTGVIVNVKSANSNGVFDIRVNNQVRKIIRTNSPTFISLRPFEKYQLNIAATGDSYYDFKHANKLVVLHKGNVQPINWIARQTVILISTIVLPNGKPLADTLIEGGTSNNNITAGNGDYQGEIYSDTTQLTAIMRNMKKCTIKLPIISDDSSIITINKLTCQTAK